MSRKYVFSSESVTEGHPDKICDQISDAVLDAVLADDPDGRVACETFATTGLVMVGGEISTKTYVDIPFLVRDTIEKIGYTDPKAGFHFENCAVITSIDQQSPDIAMGVDEYSDHQQGAGDQGIMFGYATDETEVLMPMPITLAHRLAERLAFVRFEGILDYLRPDGKTQVALEYDGDRVVRVRSVVIASQHAVHVDQDQLRSDIKREVINKVIPAELLDNETEYFINATGKFVVGGPVADTGLTGRKIIVDSYGGFGSHGGGAFSGKDPSKVDRSATYMARYIAKNLVASGIATRAQIQLAYCIGVDHPVSIFVDTFGTGQASETEIERMIRDGFPLTPKGIISHLKLKRPIYRKTAAYGHFGRELPEFTWEKTDMKHVFK